MNFNLVIVSSIILTLIIVKLRHKIHDSLRFGS